MEKQVLEWKQKQIKMVKRLKNSMRFSRDVINSDEKLFVLLKNFFVFNFSNLFLNFFFQINFASFIKKFGKTSVQKFKFIM